jgi:hypothetical protein
MNGVSVRATQHVEVACAALNDTLGIEKIGVRRGKFYPRPRRDVGESANSAFSPIYGGNVALLRSCVVPFAGVVKRGLA